MKNNTPLNIGIESRCLFGRSDAASSYVYNLIKELAVLEKKDKFHLVYSDAPFLGRSHIDFKQHNVIDHRPLLSFAAKPDLDIYHDTCCSLARGHAFRNLIVTVRYLGKGPGNTTHMKHLKEYLRPAKAVIVPSKSTRDDIVGFLDVTFDKVHVIAEGVSADFFPQSTYRTGLARARYGLKRPYILFVGPLEDRKNLAAALEAYAILRYESPPDLVIVGEKRMLKESLAESVKKSELSGLVRYLGYVPKKDLPALYCGAEALLFPSLYEGFGLPVLEAMSCAVPVIASDASSVPEVAGNAAVYVRPDSIESIACAIRSVTSSKDLKASLREKGLERAKLFSARRMASDTLKLYRKVAST